MGPIRGTLLASAYVGLFVGPKRLFFSEIASCKFVDHGVFSVDNAYVSFVTRRRAAAPRQGPEKGPGPKLWTLKKDEDNILIYCGRK